MGERFQLVIDQRYQPVEVGNLTRFRDLDQICCAGAKRRHLIHARPTKTAATYKCRKSWQMDRRWLCPSLSSFTQEVMEVARRSCRPEDLSRWRGHEKV